jgi:hypothetical protein
MKFNLLFTAVFLSVIIYANINESTGIIGLTLRDGGDGCACHALEPSAMVHVWIEGPDTVVVSDTVDYKIFMTGGPAVKGGFNVAVDYGVVDSADTLSQTLPFYAGGEQLTHTMPNTFVNDTIVWNFRYTAPGIIVVDTIYSVANSVNGDGNPIPGDEWNFGANFHVVVIDNPVTVEDEISAVQFHLSQNYPNPFNPSTTIKYTIQSSVIASGTKQSQLVTLKVYDILGNEVATLVNEEKPAGNYQFKFDAANLPSGIYFYRIQTNNFTQIKKMVLLK